MIATTIDNWTAANQAHLTAALAGVRATLERHGARDRGEPAADDAPAAAARRALDDAWAMPEPAALTRLCTIFRLSTFERQVLLLCAGMELDAAFGSLCATLQGEPARPYPTFSLALAVFPDAHWSALTPEASLRRWRLIEAGAGGSLTLSPLRIDERILHYLAGAAHLDERLTGIVTPLRLSTTLVPSHAALAERIAAAWERAAGTPPVPLIQLCGADSASQRAITAAACGVLGLNLCVLPADLVPAGAADLDTLLCLWQREAILSGSALLLDCDAADAAETAQAPAVTRLIERMTSPLVIAGRERRRIRHRPVITLDVAKPTTEEQRTLWRMALSEVGADLPGQVEHLVAQFSLDPATIDSASAEALGRAGEADLGGVLWDTCRVQARARLDDLAQRIEPVADWEALVLPEPQRQTLHEIATQVRQRVTVYEEWGLGAQGARGLGISALFAGPSGTGKTLAAEVLAHDLRLDLYRIDLSQVVSKYIGETEKNLRRVFDAAEEGGAILLFDEADALFGKRSEVKDSHDRYANIEVSYLLQRMETYRGLAILTTNLKSALDTAFLRRLRFVVQFPFPDAAQRAEIWRRVFPPATPTAGLDMSRLARLNVTGGNIRTIALSAAFLAADAGAPVGMAHLLRAARTEYAKLEKSLTEAEIGGWI